MTVGIASAGLLSYNGFDDGLTEGEALTGKAISAKGYLGSYSVQNPADSADPFFQKEGLSFSSKFFPVAGGALVLPASSSVQAVLDHGLRGDVWQSFLFKMPALPGNASSHGGVSLRPAGLADQLYCSAKAQNTGSSSSNAVRPGVGYFVLPGKMGVSTENGVSGQASEPLMEGEVYLVITHFTRVGDGLTPESPGIGRVWVFDKTSYESWRASGNSKEASLDDYALWTGQYSRESDLSEISTVATDSIFYINYLIDGLTLDEVRIGTSLGSVSVP